MSPTMLTYINEESDVPANIIRRHRQSLEEVSRFASQKTLRRILILATGSSLNAAFAPVISLSAAVSLSILKSRTPLASMRIAIRKPIWLLLFPRAGKALLPGGDA